MSTATTTVMGPLNTQDQSTAKETAVDKTTAAQKAVGTDITREAWFWEIAVPS